MKMAFMTARLDMTDVLNALLDRLGRCDTAAVATLGYNRRNFKMMFGWLDAGKVGSLTLLASIFFRSHNGGLWTETVEEFRRRGCRAACCPSHCKVMTLAFVDGTRSVVSSYFRARLPQRRASRRFGGPAFSPPLEDCP
jgi:hypothetical protein